LTKNLSQNSDLFGFESGGHQAPTGRARPRDDCLRLRQAGARLANGHRVGGRERLLMRPGRFCHNGATVRLGRYMNKRKDFG